MKKLLFLLMLGPVFFTACDDDEITSPTTTVNLNFKAVYDGTPLVSVSDKYLYPDGKQVKFQTFNFYIADVVLIEEEGADEAELVDIGFVDFSDNTTLAEAETPATFTKQKVPAGKYKGIKIGLGVPADLNTASANQFGSGHPLRKTYNSHFWTDWGSFIFMKLEGVYDKDANGFDGNDPGFGHHPGTNEVYRTVTLLRNIELKEGQPFDLNLVVDVRKLYEANGSYLDLADPANLYTHNPNDLTIANYLMNNFSQALVLQ
jgi:hypothetical protein